MAAAMAMQGADVTPTAGQVAAANKAVADARALLQKWTALKTTKISITTPPQPGVESVRRAKGYD
jgi:hypothetical protein